MQDGSQFGETDVDLQYDRVQVQLLNLRDATARLEEENGSDPGRIDELNTQAQELDQALQDWIARMPKKCSYEQHIIPGEGPWPKIHVYSPTVYTFGKQAYATAWLEYFSTRMLIFSTRLRIFTSSHPTLLQNRYEKQIGDCHAILKSTANNLASAVPFVLGKVQIQLSAASLKQATVLINEGGKLDRSQAITVIWPLSISAGLRGVDREQQRWFRSELAGLGKLLGDGIIGSAESENWIMF
jgi:hypothetical protein